MRVNLLPSHQITIGIFVALTAMPVLAASTWSNLGTNCAATSNTGIPMGNSLNCGSQGGVSLSASGFSTSNGASSTSGTNFAIAATYNWGAGNGLGVVNAYEDPSATGPHAIDNQFGTDAIRLSFGSKINLTSLSVGWTGADSDLSVLAWTGSGTPGSVTGSTLTGIVTSPGTLLNSWTLVGNYSNVMGALSIGASPTLYSSYWLISAYNQSFGNNWTIGNDQFKLLAVAGNTCVTNCGGGGGSVPEPGSIALLGAGLLGLIATRRQTKKAN